LQPTQRFGPLLKDVAYGLKLQSDWDNLVNRQRDGCRLLRFNTEKCKVMHFGYKLNTQYCMEQEGVTLTLTIADEERYLGIGSDNFLEL